MTLILTEAGGSVGFGHLTRCSAIADAYGVNSQIIVQSDEPLNEDGFNLFPWRDNLQSTFQNFSNLKRNSVLVDSYLAQSEHFEILKNYFNFVAVLDDYDRIIYPSDIIINPSILGPSYRSQNAKIYCGQDFVILRNQIFNHKNKHSQRELREIVLSFGGADSKNLFQYFLPLLMQKELIVHVIAGNQNRVNQLSHLFPVKHFHFYSHLSANEIADLFVSCDLAISASGQTLNELAFLGVPFLAIETGKDQIWNIKAFVQNNVTPFHFNADDPLLGSKVFSAIASLEDSGVRQQMSESGRKLIDGRGAQRIASLLESV